MIGNRVPAGSPALYHPQPRHAREQLGTLDRQDLRLSLVISLSCNI